MSPFCVPSVAISMSITSYTVSTVGLSRTNSPKSKPSAFNAFPHFFADATNRSYLRLYSSFQTPSSMRLCFSVLTSLAIASIFPMSLAVLTSSEFFSASYPYGRGFDFYSAFGAAGGTGVSFELAFDEPASAAALRIDLDSSPLGDDLGMSFSGESFCSDARLLGLDGSGVVLASSHSIGFIGLSF